MDDNYELDLQTDVNGKCHYRCDGYNDGKCDLDLMDGGVSPSEKCPMYERVWDRARFRKGWIEVKD